MQLDPADIVGQGWQLHKEKVWYSRVMIDSSTQPRHPPRSTMAVRHFDTEAGYENLWTHIIPLHSRDQAETLSESLLLRIRPNPHSVVTEVGQHWLEDVALPGTSSVRAQEKDMVGKGMTGKAFNLVGVVDTVAFGLGYGCMGDGWTRERFFSVAQVQADKIRGQLGSS